VVVFPRNNHSIPSSSPMLKAEPPSVYGCPGSWKKKAIIMGKWKTKYWNTTKGPYSTQNFEQLNEMRTMTSCDLD
jgi:hypothetical protein